MYNVVRNTALTAISTKKEMSLSPKIPLSIHHQHYTGYYELQRKVVNSQWFISYQNRCKQKAIVILTRK